MHNISEKCVNLKLEWMNNYDTKLKKKKIIHILDTSRNATLLSSKVGNKKFINYLKSLSRNPPPPLKIIMDMFGVGMFHALSYPIEAMTYDSSHESTKSNYLLYILFN